MLRRANDAGGFGVVLAKGDAQGGAILVVAMEPRTEERLLERGIGPEGSPTLIDSTPGEDVTGYWRRRRGRDPDLWVIELNVPGVERLVAEILLTN